MAIGPIHYIAYLTCILPATYFHCLSSRTIQHTCIVRYDQYQYDTGPGLRRFRPLHQLVKGNFNQMRA
jgi:hypothetical protein